MVFAVYAPDRALAQFTGARTYENSPVDINQLELGYSYVRANSSIDSSLIIHGARINLNQGSLDYTRYFGLFHRLSWAEATVPFAGLSGEISDTPIHGSATGAGDSSYAVAILVKGGAALGAAQFESYMPTTTCGLSLSLTAPTGLYHPNSILNLGSNRWILKPELALAHPLGEKWEIDGYANALFFTKNSSYHGNGSLRQEPLPGLEAYMSYSFTEGIWMSLDTRYSFYGTTALDGASENNFQHNFAVGTELSISLSARNSVIVEFAKAVVHENGPALAGFSVRYNYIWGNGIQK